MQVDGEFDEAGDGGEELAGAVGDDGFRAFDDTTNVRSDCMPLLRIHLWSVRSSAATVSHGQYYNRSSWIWHAPVPQSHTLNE